jgi:hypothetical protein
MAFIAAAGLLVSAESLASDHHWIAGGSGIWDVAGNWSPASIPNAPGQAAVIDAPGSYIISLGSNISPDSISILNPETTLSFGGRTITLGGAGLLNAGRIDALVGTSTISGDFRSEGHVTIRSGATLVLRDGSFVNDGTVLVRDAISGGASVMSFTTPTTIQGEGEIRLSGNTVPHTIAGRGRIGGTLVNESLILADSVAGPLALNAQIEQSESGIVRASGGSIQLVSSLTGGSIQTGPGGSILCVGVNARLERVRIEGHIQVPTNTSLTLSGASLTVDGLISAGSVDAGINARVIAPASMTLEGTGEIRLAPAETPAQLEAGTGVIITIGPDLTVSGAGSISAPIANNGAIVADVPGEALKLHRDVTCSAGGILVADGGLLDLESILLKGGATGTANGGRIRATSSNTRIDDVTLTGSTEVLRTLKVMNSTLRNEGEITVNSVPFNTTTTIELTQHTSIEGGGVIRLAGATLEEARLYSPSRTVTLREGNVVAGVGRISGSAMVNEGTILGDDPAGPLVVSTSAFTQSATGVLAADGGAVDLGSSLISGGGIETSPGSAVRTVAESSVTLDGVAIRGSLHAQPGSTLTLRGPVVVNEGDIVINPDTNPRDTMLRINEPCAFEGAGRIILAGLDYDARFVALGTGALATIGSDQTVGGIGRLVGDFRIDGSIDPGVGVGGVGTLRAEGTICYGPGSRLVVDAFDAATHDRVVGTAQHSIEGGTVHIVANSSFSAPLGTRMPVLSGASRTGTFASIEGPDPGLYRVWRLAYAPGLVEAVVACIADTNADETIDVLDFLGFIEAFSRCDGQPAPCGWEGVDADINGDTVVDILDFLDFIDAFSTGC